MVWFGELAARMVFMGWYKYFEFYEHFSDFVQVLISAVCAIFYCCFD